MRHAIIFALPILSGGCALNIYWTDYVVHGELHLRQNAQREPIPLELKAKGEVRSQPEHTKGDPNDGHKEAWPRH